VIKTTQFGRRMQSIPIGTEPVMDQANADNPPYRCMIGGHKLTHHTPTTPRVVGHRSIEVTPPAHISKHERDKREDLRHQS
jgi:hypothetical protein